MVKSGKLGGKPSGKFENAYGRAGLFLDIDMFIIWNGHDEDTSLILRCVLFSVDIHIMVIMVQLYN